MRVLGIASQQFRPLFAQIVGRLSCRVQQALTFGVDVLRRLAQECSSLLIEGLILVLKFVAFFLRLFLLRVRVRKHCGDPLLPRIDGVEYRLVEIAL